MTTKEIQIPLSGDEMCIVEQVAFERGISIDEAAGQLCSEAIAKRMRKKTGRSPAFNVRNFRGRKG